MNIKCFWPALNPAHGTQSKFSPQEGPRWPPVPGSSRALPSISSSWQSLSRAPPSPSPCAGCGSRARGAALWQRAVLGARWLLPSPDCRGFSSSPEHTLSLGEAGQPALHGSTVGLGELLLPGSGRWELPHPELRTRGGIPGSSPAADCSGLGIFQPFSSVRPSRAGGVPVPQERLEPGAASVGELEAAQQACCLDKRTLPFSDKKTMQIGYILCLHFRGGFLPFYPTCGFLLH